MTARNRGKVVMVGDSKVGKSSLVNAFRNLPFSAQIRPTLGAGSWPIQRKIDNALVAIDLWDTAGQDAFASLVPYYTRGANAVLLTFSLEDPISFQAIRQWSEIVGQTGSIPYTFLIGNKSDCPRAVRYDDALALAESLGARYCETSAKTGNGIEEALTEVMLALGGIQAPLVPDTTVNIAARPQSAASGGKACC
jgi:small GTP-binding protein